MLSQINSQLARNFFRISGCACFAVAIVFALNTVMPAQGTTSGGFKGIVRDRNTGAPISGAKVVLKNQQFGTQTTIITGDNGTYLKTSLQPGDYDIEVSANGYESQNKVQTLYAMANYAVEPDPFDLVAMRPISTPTPAPVTADAAVPTPTPAIVAPVKRQTSGVGESISLDSRRVGIFNRASVNGLPLGSTTLTRTFDELAFLIPGVNPPPQAIGNTVGPGVGGGVGTSGQFSVNGLRSRANNFTVDGSDNNDEDIGVRRQGFFALVPQPIESIQEYQITTLLAPAEFGRNLGAQVNAISKSGGNQFHGSLYGLFNSERFNARNYFDNAGGNTSTTLTGIRPATGTSVPVFIDLAPKQLPNNAGEKDKLSLLQGGFAIGGRLVRDKLFFFVSGEGQRLRGTQERNFAVPTVSQRGLFNSGITGLQQCQPGLGGTIVNGTCRASNGTPVNFSRGFPTSVGGDAVFSLFPFANNPNGIYGANTYTQALSTDANGRILSGKVDYNFERFGQRQTFTVRYNNTDDKRDLTDVGGALFSAIRPVVRTDNFASYLGGGLTDNISNELRFSWGRTRLRFDELPDTTGFLLPVSSSVITNASERRFLLNAPNVQNDTLPVGCTPTGCFAPSQVTYTTRGNTAQNSSLGPIGQLNVAGFSPVGVDVFNFPQQRKNDTYQIADTLRWQIRSHSLAFGTDIRRVFLDSDLPRNSRPLVTFYGGACDFCFGSDIAAPQDLAAAGAATGFFQSLISPNNDSRIRLDYNQFDFFGQDTWRIGSKFSVSLGLRYEYNTTPKEADNKIEKTFQIRRDQFPTLILADLFRGFNDVINGRTKIYDPDRNNLAPRLGFALASASGRTVVRGGYGIYYDQIIGSVVSQSRNVFPTFITANTGGGDLACNATFELLNPITGPFNPIDCSRSGRIVAPGTLNTVNPAFTLLNLLRGLYFFPAENGTSFGTTLPTRKLNTPMSHQFSFGVEQRLFGDTFLSAAYVGSTGRDLLRFTTPNLGANYLTVVQDIFLDEFGNPRISGTTFDAFSNNNLERPNKNIGPVNQFETTGRSRYDSFQIAVRGRLKRSFQYQANYVYGDVKDDVSDVFDLAGSFALPQNSLTFAGEYAAANFDIRHRFTYSFIYGLPAFNNRGRGVKYLLGGWEISGTGKFNTGQPFTVNTVFDRNFDGNLTDRLNNTAFITQTDRRQSPLSLTCSTAVACRSMLAAFGSDGSVPRNSFRAGSILDLDMSLSRRFRFTENHNLQFRVDFFNFINRANFGVPVRFLEAPGFGRANDTVTPGRRIQFGLKYNF